MKTLIFLWALLMCARLSGQNDQGKLDDVGRIALASVVADDLLGLNPATQSLLQHKLDQITTRYGMGSSALNDRFIITAHVQVVSQDITPTAPPMHAYTLEVGFFVGDGIDGTLFAATARTFKGVGETTTKAYKAALNQIETADPAFKSLLEAGKNKIVTYYNTRCDFLLKEADMLVSRNEFDAAIYKLVGIPEVCKDCYDKAMETVATVYQKQIDYECTRQLADARNAWQEGLDTDAARKAGEFLGQVDPHAKCYAEAQQLSAEIGRRIRELDQREWDFKLKQQQDAVDARRASIAAAEAIGVAYGKNQPKSAVYNYRSWW